MLAVTEMYNPGSGAAYSLSKGQGVTIYVFFNQERGWGLVVFGFFFFRTDGKLQYIWLSTQMVGVVKFA